MKHALPLAWLPPAGGELVFRRHRYVTKIGGELWIVDHVRALPVAGGWSYELVRRVRRGEMVGGVDLAERDRLVAELFDLGDVYPVPECVGKLMEGLG